MEVTGCVSCLKPKAKLTCGVCQGSICKNCTQFVDEDTFSFMPVVSEDLKKLTYCVACYEARVAPALAGYQKTMDQARETLVFMKTQSKETRLIKRLEDPIQVLECADHDQALLRLAFLAALKGYNSIIDVELVSKKVKIDSYQTTIWNGFGIPAQVNESKLIKDRSLWQNPN